MNEKAGDSYFIDDIFYGKKSSAMVEFSRLRVEIALDMIGSETLETVRSLKVLDVGCGDGEFSVMILNMGHEVHGIDSKPDLVACARRKGIKAKVADVRKGLPYEDENFDLVYAAEILEHIYDTELFLKEVYRVLKKDGAVILTVPNIACLPNRIRMIFGLYPRYIAPARRHWGVGEHVRAFTKNMLFELLGRRNFNVDDVKSNLVTFMPTRRTRRPWSKTLGQTFPSLGEVLIIKARKKVRENRSTVASKQVSPALREVKHVL